MRQPAPGEVTAPASFIFGDLPLPGHATARLLSCPGSVYHYFPDTSGPGLVFITSKGRCRPSGEQPGVSTVPLAADQTWTVKFN